MSRLAVSQTWKKKDWPLSSSILIINQKMEIRPRVTMDANVDISL